MRRVFLSNISISILSFVFISLGALSPTLFAAERPIYETVIHEKSSDDILNEDLFVPKQEFNASKSQHSDGSLKSDLERVTGLPMKMTGAKAGGLTSAVIGGKSADETGFETMGIPLNPPQGGGLDLSSLPAMLFSRGSVRSGNFGGAYDPRGTASTVSLVPWTLDAMNSDKSGFDVFTQGSSSQLFQEAVGFHYNHPDSKLGIIAGDSQGNVSGPFGGASFGSGPYRFHILSADQKAQVLGSKAYPTHDTTQTTIRTLVSLEYQGKIEQNWNYALTPFLDLGYLRLEDGKDLSTRYRAHFSQYGFQGAATDEDSRLGVGFRSLEFNTLSVTAPTQSIFHVEGAHTFTVQDFKIEPLARLVGDQSIGVLPEGALSIKRNDRWMGGTLMPYARVSYSNEFPSLISRYSSSKFTGYEFVANKDLATETMVSPRIGAEFQNADWHFTLEGSAEFRENTIVTTTTYDAFFNQTDRVENKGDSKLYRAVESAEYQLNAETSLSEKAVFSVSRISQTNQEIPYERRVTSYSSFKYRFATLTYKAISSAYVSPTQRLSGSGQWDLGLAGSLCSSMFSWNLGVENALNNTDEQVAGYDPSGRVWFAGLSAHF